MPDLHSPLSATSRLRRDFRRVAATGCGARSCLCHQKRTWSFQQAFLANVRRNGRLNELELIGAFKGRMFADDWSLPGLMKDSLLAPQLMRRGKFHFTSDKVEDRSVVRRIFARCLGSSQPEGAVE